MVPDKRCDQSDKYACPTNSIACYRVELILLHKCNAGLLYNRITCCLWSHLTCIKNTLVIRVYLPHQVSCLNLGSKKGMQKFNSHSLTSFHSISREKKVFDVNTCCLYSISDDYKANMMLARLCSFELTWRGHWNAGILIWRPSIVTPYSFIFA